MMRITGFILFCFVCPTHAVRVKKEQVQHVAHGAQQADASADSAWLNGMPKPLKALTLLLATFNPAAGWQISPASTAATPARVVLDPLPSVYVYDHCPFCVRVRLALGAKNVKHDIRFLANDDVQTPTSLVGKKIAPIFQLEQDALTMAESLDIIDRVDKDERFGPTGFIKPATGRTDIKAWQKSVQTILRTLQRPRYVATGLLPEFQTLDGRNAFIKNHQLPPYEKAEWKEGSMTTDDKIAKYAEAMASDPSAVIAELNAKLIELNDMVYCDKYCSEGGFSYDDIDLWARLRSITIIKGVQWPQKLRAYMDNLSAMGDVPLYDDMAL